jgi:hypothetical protein
VILVPSALPFGEYSLALEIEALAKRRLADEYDAARDVYR